MPKNHFGELNKVHKWAAALFMGVLVVGAMIAVPLLFNGKTNAEDLKEVLPPPKAEEPVALEIVCIGDIMVHESQIPSQYDEATGTYDYTNNFQYVKKYLEAADLAMGNFEGTFGGPPYRGYPAFSTPDELADAMKWAGIDVAITANNHMTDKGHAGVIRTLEVLRAAGLTTSGSRLDTEEPAYSMTSVKGVNVAVVAYTYETSGSGPEVTINGSSISQETAQLINSFSYNRLSADLERIGAVVSSAREAGADLVVLYLHWGEEYQRAPNLWQEQIAEAATEKMQVDMIFASHPHVLQPMEMIHSETTGRDVPVFYSMGNFISNQREETLQNRFTEQGVIAKVNLFYMVGTKEIVSIEMEAISTWVDRYNDIKEMARPFMR